MAAATVVTMSALVVGTLAASAQSPSAAPAAASTGYAELDQAMGADKPFAGSKVSIQTQWIGGEGANFAAALQPFQDATGIQVQVDSIGSSHETVLKTRIEGGAPPDLAMLAQPAAIKAYGAEGKLIDIASFIDTKKLADEHPATVGLYSDGDKIWAIPYKVDVKSTVWYPIKAFEAAGYKVPTTYDELKALEAQIVADGSNPWCIGMEAGSATGWQATDWLEDIVLRTAGVDAYNKWITHELKFDSPEIKKAMDILAEIFFTEGNVYGGNTAIVATPQTQPMDPMFPTDGNWDGFKPGCWMQKQATWYGPDFFPDQRTSGQPSQFKIGEDIGLFYFPAIDPAQGTPALGAGDALLMMADRPEVRALAEYLSTPAGIEAWIKAGSAISANQTTPADWYAGSYKLAVASDIVAKATSFGFDASDLMPPQVGAGAEWTELTNWISSGGADTEKVLQNIDAAWPAQ
ncbi:MAG: ABC transporter substrate-binding protein [Chloroflexota bacterium]